MFLVTNEIKRKHEPRQKMFVSVDGNGGDYFYYNPTFTHENLFLKLKILHDGRAVENY